MDKPHVAPTLPLHQSAHKNWLTSLETERNNEGENRRGKQKLEGSMEEINRRGKQTQFGDNEKRVEGGDKN